MKKLVLMLMLLAPMTMMAQKFGKVNTQTIMQALPDVAKANGELEALQKQKDNELKAMQEESIIRQGRTTGSSRSPSMTVHGAASTLHMFTTMNIVSYLTVSILR